jgi:uncharacterized protein
LLKYALAADDKRIRFSVTLITALIGGFIFTILRVPIPWLLGPMASVLVASRFIKIKFYWPGKVRDTGLIIVGYSFGLSFTKEALLEIVAKLPSMLLMTVLLICFCAGIAFVVSKLSGVDYPTVLIGSIPGGLSQMIMFAEELKGINITTVTFLQVARLIMIIFFVPFLLFGPLFNNTVAKELLNGTVESTTPLFPAVIWFAVICVMCAFLARKLKFPTAYLLGPIIGTAIFNLSGFQGPALPHTILDASQFMIGGHVGLLLKPENLDNKTKIITLALISGMVMILGSIGLSILLVFFYPITASTSFLALAPGGMDQMGILAHVVQADLSMVTGYQLFRLLFIYFAVPPILRWIFIFGRRKTAKAL